MVNRLINYTSNLITMVHGMFNNMYNIVKLVLWVLPITCLIILLAGDHALCRSGYASSVSCKVVAVWRPCFVRVVPVVHLVMLLQSEDHVLCWLGQQHVL